MPLPIVTAPDIWWVEVGDDALTLRVDREVYSDEAIFRTCYLFTDRCYLWLDRDGPDHLVVRFRKRTDADLTHTGEYRGTFTFGTVTKLNKWLGCQNSFGDVYVSEPPVGKKKNDLLFSTGLNLSFVR